GVSASDSCSRSNGICLFQAPAPGTLATLGPYTTLFQSTYEAGNSATCTTTFTVIDTAVPTVSCPAPASASADGNCQAAVPNVLSGVAHTASCSGTSDITLGQPPDAGTLVGLGAHTITVT